MRRREVVFRGKDGEFHTYLVNARASKFDAADKGIREAKFSLYGPELTIVVRPFEPASEYRVTVSGVRAERKKKRQQFRPR